MPLSKVGLLIYKTNMQWVHPDEAKGAKAIAVPLNIDAIRVLQQQIGMHSTFVFTFRQKSVSNVNTRAWRKALIRAGIKNSMES